MAQSGRWYRQGFGDVMISGSAPPPSSIVMQKPGTKDAFTGGQGVDLQPRGVGRYLSFPRRLTTISASS